MEDAKEKEVVEINSSAIAFAFRIKKRTDGYKNENYSPRYRRIFYLAFFFSATLMKKTKLSYLPLNF